MPGKHHRRATSVSLSQHFLRDHSVADRIIAATGLAPPARVFDLGAGDGLLTEAAVARGCRVVPVELDRLLWQRLRARFRGNALVAPRLADLLQVELPSSGPYAVVSNVPFALTARLLRRLQNLPNPPAEAWLIVQAEAAQKWAGVGHETLASVLLKLRFEVDVALALHRRDFVPRPSVDAVVLRLRRRKRLLLPPADARAFEAFVRRAFAGPDSRRARELSLEDWIAAFQCLPSGPGRARPTVPRQPSAGPSRGVAAPGSPPRGRPPGHRG
jgi:23S rRNA (adenine-N6)-dimethyltransferase